MVKKATPQSQKEQSATAEPKKKKEEPKEPEKMEVDESDSTKKAIRVFLSNFLFFIDFNRQQQRKRKEMLHTRKKTLLQHSSIMAKLLSLIQTTLLC